MRFKAFNKPKDTVQQEYKTIEYLIPVTHVKPCDSVCVPQSPFIWYGIEQGSVWPTLNQKYIYFLPLPCSVFLSVIMLVLLAGIFLLHLTGIILLLVATIDNVSNPPLLLHLVLFMLT